MSVRRFTAALPDEPLVELQNVSRRFEKKLDRNRSLQDLFIRLLTRKRKAVDEFWPLRDVNLTVRRGDCVGVVGPNGSGKSTLLKVISGILVPTSGDMTVRGRVSSLLELGAGFKPDLSGRENIYLNGSIYGLSRREMASRLESIVEFAELGDFIDTPVKHYSSGMYVRLGFAVAIHTDPDLLLVDEVLAVGDVTFQHKCIDAIRRFRDNGGTLLLVSHDLGAIQTICNHALWIESGHVMTEGRPVDVVMDYLAHMAERERLEIEHKALPQLAEGRRWGSGEIRIERVELCDAKGKPKLAFLGGQPMEIRMTYRCDQRIERPNFGLAIHHQNGTLIFGPNTNFGGLPLAAVEGDGTVTYRIPSLPLLEGSYTVTVAAVNGDDSVTYDYHDRAYPFRVYPGAMRDGYGMITLQGTWQATSSTGSPTGSSAEPPEGRDPRATGPAQADETPLPALPHPTKV